MKLMMGLLHKATVMSIIYVVLFLPKSLSLNRKPNSITGYLLLNEYNRSKVVMNIIQRSLTKVKDCIAGLYEISTKGNLEQLKLLKSGIQIVKDSLRRNEHLSSDETSRKKSSSYTWIIPKFTDEQIQKNIGKIKPVTEKRKDKCSNCKEMPKSFKHTSEPLWGYSWFLQYLKMPVPLYWAIMTLPISAIIYVIVTHALLIGKSENLNSVTREKKTLIKIGRREYELVGTGNEFSEEQGKEKDIRRDVPSMQNHRMEKFTEGTCHAINLGSTSADNLDRSNIQVEVGNATKTIQMSRISREDADAMKNMYSKSETQIIKPSRAIKKSRKITNAKFSSRNRKTLIQNTCRERKTAKDMKTVMTDASDKHDKTQSLYEKGRGESPPPPTMQSPYCHSPNQLERDEITNRRTTNPPQDYLVQLLILLRIISKRTIRNKKIKQKATILAENSKARSSGH